MNDEMMLRTHLDWLVQDVVPGFARRGDEKSIRFAEMQIANIQWRLTTGRDAPSCGWKGLYADHPADCFTCRVNRERIGR